MHIINDNRKIPYIHYKHNNSNVVVVCHSFLWHKSSAFNKILQEHFTIDWIDSFSFDFYGHGEADWDISSMTIDHCISDLTAVINYLTQEYDNISLVANSMWWLIALTSTKIHAKLNSLVLRSPVSDWYKKELNRIWVNGISEWIINGFTEVFYGNVRVQLSSWLLKSMKKFNAYSLAWGITCPVLIIHWNHDKNIPIEQSHQLRDLIAHAELFVIENWWHSRKSVDQDSIINKIVSFTCSHFKSNVL